MSREVHDMFFSIAPRYDCANDVLSFGLHRLWRDRALRLGGVRAGNVVVDICTGTGDVAFAAAKLVGSTGQVFGVDFVLPMLELASRKAVQFDHSAAGSSSDGLQAAAPVFLQGDALRLPFPDSFADNATVSFGIRNVDRPEAGLAEMFRVLKPGGTAIVIEFGRPLLPGFRQVYDLYCKFVMPQIGGLLTGNKQAYEYLPRTSKAFPAGDDFAQLMRQAGFLDPQFTPLLSGLAYIYVGHVSVHGRD